MVHIRLLTAVLALLISLVSAASYTSPPSGAVIVRKSPQSGEFSTIQAAVNSLDSSSDKTIFIYPGTYNEQVLISRAGKLTIRGYTTDTASYSANQVTISSGLSAAAAGSNDLSGTLRVKKSNFALYNVNVKNTFGKGSQAIALSAYGNQQAYYACQFTGYQDTILTNEGTHYFVGSYVEGATDYIFGQRSLAYFYKSTIASVGAGYITASGRDSDTNPSKYVFDSCNIILASGAASGTKGNVYLGRPWRPYARVVFKYSSISDVIHPAGWRIWNTGNEQIDHVFYGEYNNSGAGAWNSKRVSFATKMSDDKGYTIGEVLGSGYSAWVDAAYGTTGSGGAVTTTVKTTTTVKVTTTVKTTTPVKPVTTTTKPATTTSSGGANCAPMWGQCGGQGFTGATCCSAGTCTVSNAWYSQCI